MKHELRNSLLHAACVTLLYCGDVAGAFGQVPPFPASGCRIRYHYDEAGNRTRREWQCWGEGEGRDEQSGKTRQPEIERVSVFDENELHLSPNPASDMLNFRLSHGIPGARAELLDMAGHVLRTATLTSGSGQFNVSELPDGSYAIRIVVPEEILITTFIVMR